MTSGLVTFGGTDSGGTDDSGPDRTESSEAGSGDATDTTSDDSADDGTTTDTPTTDGSSSTGPETCVPTTCAELGWACGYAVSCGEPIDCADEGLACADDEVCVGGVDAATVCEPNVCAVCHAVPDCTTAPQPTRLSGRVVSPGRDDADTGNQVGIPNAIVYILQTLDEGDIPAIETGIPTDGTSCDRCEDRDLGPVLAGTLTDARGFWELEGQIPVGVEFMLVVHAGKFRRATTMSLPDEAACETTELETTLPENPTRLPRHMDDGLAVNLPKFAISTGQIDAMECVLEKMGIDHGEFGNPGNDGSAPERIHIYRGGSSGNPSGARIDGSTPHDAALYGDLDRIHTYDIVVADCEGGAWDSSYAQRDASGAHVREYVNRGGRFFASHLSHSWLRHNGSEAYSMMDPLATGLGDAATWSSSAISSPNSGPGRIAIGRTHASSRIDAFAEWMVHENVVASAGSTFTITDPRSQATALGDATEEFVYCDTNGSGGCSNYRTQQFSFTTPYASPPEDACGRVSYSGFHVVSGGGTNPFANAVFPAHCTGSLTKQEKVLLYMLFDLGACVGIPEIPTCTPADCGSQCGLNPDGCGGLMDCGACPLPG